MRDYRYSGQAKDLFSAKCVRCINGGYDDGYCGLKQDKYNCEAKLFWCQYENLWVSETISCKACNRCNSCFTMRAVFGNSEQKNDACRLFAYSVVDSKFSIWEMKMSRMLKIWGKILRIKEDLTPLVVRFALEYATIQGINGLTESDIKKRINDKIGYNCE